MEIQRWENISLEAKWFEDLGNRERKVIGELA